LGLDAKELLRIVLEVDPKCFLVPAHCLLPNTIVHTRDNLLKPIQEIQKGELVITHNNKWQKVKEIFKRPYSGKIYHIKPRNFSLGLTTTPEHPFYAIRMRKNCCWNTGICKPPHLFLNRCKNKYFKDYKPQWIMVNQLERGDVLIYPRFANVFTNHKEINLKEIISQSIFKTKVQGEFIMPVGSKITDIKQRIIIDKDFCRLAGYYLAEGYTNSRDLIGFAFSDKEKKYVDEVIDLMKKVLGFDKEPKLKTNRSGGIEVLFYSKILYEAFRRLFYFSDRIHDASTKALPNWVLGLSSDLQAELFRYWWRGDSGYTASRLLMNQMKIILLRLGIVPSIYIDKRDSYNSRPKHFIKERKIGARYDMYSLNRLSFYEDKFNLLQEPEFAKVAKYNKGKKYGWIDDDYIYLPIYDIKIEDYKGEVYNLEVEEDNSYVCEFATVHNCWTPWFALFGSMSGFNSVEECFEELSDKIFALETGLSSDPLMNWRLSQLDKYTLISCSDAHSPVNLGREACVFKIEPSRLSFDEIKRIIKEKDKEKFLYTIEFFPEEGKYHYDGHRLCKTRLSPKETKKYSGFCPVCGKPLTIGVMSRVEQLADREENFTSPDFVPFKSLVPLREIIAESLAQGKATKLVEEEYEKLVSKGGNEFKVLLDLTEAELEKITLPKIVEGIIKVRQKELFILPGYDGEYGTVKIFSEGEKSEPPLAQQSLF
jgi:uncharacterized protein (TIGR00375 family)